MEKYNNEKQKKNSLKTEHNPRKEGMADGKEKY